VCWGGGCNAVLQSALVLGASTFAGTAAEAGEAALGSRCSWQESKLAVLWNIGVFALNFGPVLVGPVLDWVGPKLTAILGARPASPDEAALRCPYRMRQGPSGLGRPGVASVLTARWAGSTGYRQFSAWTRPMHYSVCQRDGGGPGRIA